MKIAVVNFSGNVGKTTVSRHLLMPNLPGSELVSVESINADETGGDGQDNIRGKEFARLQTILNVGDNLIIDIGASNVEDLLNAMVKFHGSHEDFDYFVIPTVPDKKQQIDTANTCDKLASIGVQPSRIKILFNRVPADSTVERSFESLLSFLKAHPIADVNTLAYLGDNEVYQLLKNSGSSIDSIAQDTTDYKKLIASTSDVAQKVALSDKLALKRLAAGVLPELKAAYQALSL